MIDFVALIRFVRIYGSTADEVLAAASSVENAVRSCHAHKLELKFAQYTR